MYELRGLIQAAARVETAIGALRLTRPPGDLCQMPKSLNRFLRHSTGLSKKASLGRVFNVTRETWRLTDDPSAVAPQTELLVTRRSASDAADLARDAAEAYSRHGFHKPSGAWWAADDERFHRFVVHAGRRGGTTVLLLVSGLAGLAALTLARRRSHPGTPRAHRAARGKPLDET